MRRREFLGALGPFAAAALGPALVPARAAAALAAFAADERDAERVARDEDLWFDVQRAFTVDRSLVNLNNGGVSPAPAMVQEAMARHLAYSNELPAYTMWRVLEPQREGVRQRLARHWKVDPEEVAITRNASESLQIAQFGVDLRAGDEVLTTTMDYPRMLTTFEQRARREGVVLRKIELPVPCEDDALVVRRFEQAIGERTRLILVCHVINLNGQVLPVKAICALGRARGIPVIVDGAHAFAHLPFGLDEIGADYYGTSLHKWLAAPHGTGLLYVRRERIAGTWPLMAAGEGQVDDVRKFEEIGTHPAANALAIGEALTFHEGIGDERKYARLVYLRDRWAKRLVEHERVRLHTSLRPGFAGGIATVQIEGVDTVALQHHLWERHRILTTNILHRVDVPDAEDRFEGLRVSPSVYTSLAEVDRFADAMEAVLRDGLPA